MFFNYAHVPWLMKTMRKFDESTFPKPQEKLEMLKDTIDFFTTNGYKMVWNGSLCKPEDELFKAIQKVNSIETSKDIQQKVVLI